jgi:nucleoside-diphosphate-sugar epimerase
MRVLLTGATGAFGRYLARELLNEGHDVVAVIRASSDLEADARVRAAVGLRSGTGLTGVAGDLAAPMVGLARHASVLRCDVALHSAATTAFDLPLAAARQTNVQGTLNLLDLAGSLPRLRAVGYVGTAFVAGKRCGRISECELHHRAGFVNSYEQSKYEAERAARRYGLPLSVFRPSIVTEDEPTTAPSAMRFVLRLIARGLLPSLPGPENASVDIIGGRDAAAAIVALLVGRPPGGVFHIAAGDTAPLVSELVARCTARQVSFLDAPAFGRELARLKASSPIAHRLYEPLHACIGVLAHPKVFDTRNSEAALGRPLAHTDPVVLAGLALREAA